MKVHTMGISNILAVRESASAADVTDGLVWYPRAQTAAEVMGARYDVPTEAAAGVIAAYSPKTEWAQNLKRAEGILMAWSQGISPHDARNPETGNGYGMGEHREKSLRILQGEDIEVVLNALKTRNFYRCIMGCTEAICIDGHAQNIAMHGMMRRSITEVPSLTPAQYHATASLYIEAADILGESRATLQAITWCTYKRMFLKKLSRAEAAAKRAAAEAAKLARAEAASQKRAEAAARKAARISAAN